MNKLRQKWLNKRYKMRKQVDVEPDNFTEHERFEPLLIKNGDESKEGPAPIEIDWSKVDSIQDIEIDTEIAEIEVFCLNEEKLIVWFDGQFNPDTSFYIYYGCKSKWWKVLDKFFHTTKTS